MGWFWDNLIDVKQEQFAALEQRVAALEDSAGDEGVLSSDGVPSTIKTPSESTLDECRECERLRATLKFYADPETYFAIGFFPDSPCGEFADDFSEAEDGYGLVKVKPGKRARAALKKTDAAEDNNGT